MINIIRLIIILSFGITATSCLDYKSVLNSLGLMPDPQNDSVLDHNSVMTSSNSYLYRAFNLNPISRGYPAQIEQINLTTKSRTTILGSGNGNSLDGVGLSAEFFEIEAMVYIPGSPEKLIVGDWCTIREVNLSTLNVTTVAGTTGVCVEQNGIGTAATFELIRGLAVSGTTLYIATANQIKQMDLITYSVSSFAGSDTKGDLDGVGAAAALYPARMTLVGNNLYILDFNLKIKRIGILDASVTTVAGQSGVGTNNSIDGTGTTATIDITNVSGLTSDGFKNIFWTENQKIRSLDTTTNIVKTILNSTAKPQDIDSTNLSDAKVYNPSGIHFTDLGIFISNEYGVRILK